MSTYVTLKMPITDLACLKKALETKGIAYTESGNKLTLNNGIRFEPGEIGFYVALIPRALPDQIVREIETEYNIQFSMKQVNLQERLKKLNALSDAERKTVLEEKRRLDERNQHVLGNMVKKIEERAKQKGYTIQQTKGQNNSVQLVLVRQKT